MYAIDNNTYCVAGGGNLGTGYGWFSHDNGSSYPASVSAQLVAGGYLSSNIVDPSGVTNNNQDNSGYMVYCDNSHYTLWANLEDPTTSDTATQDSCHFSQYDNHHSEYPAEVRKNYCISN